MKHNYAMQSAKSILTKRLLLLFAMVFLWAYSSFGQARLYTATQGTAAYVSITGTASTAAGDDGTQELPMPIPFVYGGSPVTNITISTNGFIRMTGGAIFASSWVNSLPSTVSLPVVAPFWDDHNLTGGVIEYTTTGTAPNRVFIVEWKGLRTSGSGSSNSTTFARFQTHFLEGTNEIKFHYGTSNATTTGVSGSIGLSTLPGGFGEFASITPGTALRLSNTVENGSIVTVPDSGVVYTLKPNSGCVNPWAIRPAAYSQDGFTIRWNSGAGATGYQYVVTSSTTLPTTGTATTDTFAVITGLTPATLHYVYVRTACAGGTFSPWAGPIGLLPGQTVTAIASGNWFNPTIWSTGSVPTLNSNVIISGGRNVVVDTNATIASITIGNGTSNDTLSFNAATARTFAVTFDITVAPNGLLNTTPTIGTAARNIFVAGNFVNNGTANLSSNATLLAFNGIGGQAISGTGTFANGNTVREIQADNGLTISTPINISARFTLVNGVLTTNGNLTMDNTLGGVTTGAVNFRRSVVTPAINGLVNVGPTAVYNLDYVFFTGQAARNCTTSTEIPVSRSINGLRYSVATGNFLFVAGGNLTLTSSSNSTTATTFPNTATAPGALILGAGRVIMPTGSELIFGNGALPNVTTGSATAYIQGKVTWTVTNTAAQTRNFRIGDATDGFLVVLGTFIPGSTPQTYSAELVGAPLGSVNAPLTTTLGTRAVRLTASAPLSSGATVQLNWTATDQLVVGNINQLRIVQAPALSGPWTERSVASGSGVITATGSRTTAAGTSLANGEFFGFGTVSLAEIEMAGITGLNLNKGCYSTNETLRVVVRNTGTPINYATTPVTFNGSITTPGGSVINLTPVTRSTGTVANSAFDTITFTNALDLSAPGKFRLQVQIDSLLGQSRTTDTIRTIIRSHEFTARVNPSQIVTGQSSNLSVGTAERLRFTEFTQFFAGTGQTPAYPPFVTSSTTDPDLLEMTNMSNLFADLSGHRLEILGTGARNYTFPQGTIVPPYGIVIVHIGAGTNQPNNNFYNTGGSNGLISSTSQTGYIFRDTSGAIIDAVATNGYIFPASAGVSIADWGGAIPASSAGVSLIAADINNAAAWRISSAAQPQTVGTLNPGVVPDTASVTWTGPASFTANTPAPSTGIRNAAGTDVFNASVSFGGCVKSASTSLSVVNPIPPIAGFRVSADTTTTGGVVGTVTLTDTSLNIPFTRRWTITPNTVQFVNNTNDSAAVAQVQFLQPGMYSIKLRVANPAGADSVTRANGVFVRFVYCPSNATNTGDSKIDSIIIGNTTTGSANATCETYTDNSGLGVVATLTRSFSFPIQVKNGHCGATHYPGIMKAYVDVNKDGSFTENERVAILGPTTARAWNTMNLVVPATADTGVTRLRIVLRETTTASDVTGCGPYPYGETEDYTVRIVAPALTNFNLVGPVDSIYLNVVGQSTQTVSANWQRTIPAVAGPITYAWQLAARSAGNFNAPLATLAANNNGADTMITLTYGAIDQLMSSLGVAVGDTVRGIWRVRAVRGTDTLYSLQTYDIDLRRGAVIFNCPITAVPTNIIGDTVCLSGSATLSANAPGPQDVVWYNPNNTIGAVGSSISTGTISTTTTFQVGLGNAQNGNQAFGPISPTTGTFPAGNFTNGMYYTVFANIRVDSVTFFTNGAREGAMQVWDKNPTEDPTAVLLQVVPWNIPGSGVQRVPVKMYLTPGRYYINNAYGAGTGVLFRTTGGATFPYELPGKIRLDSSWLAPGSNLARIYYFFDMRISDACFGPTAPATVTVEPAPAATLPYSLDLENGVPCNYINAGAWQQGTAAGLSGPGFTIPAPAAGTGIAAAKTAGRLISPSFDFSTLTASNNITMTFNAYNNGTNGSKAYVEVSLDSGATFIRIDSVAAGAAWQTKTVNLGAYAGRPSVHFALNHAIQGGNGSGFAVDNIAINSSCGAAQVVVRLVTDIYGSEITWALTDSATGTLVAAGGPYPDVNPYNAAAATHVDTFCVPVGARLKFRINDSFGDGLWDGTRAGTYSVSLICPAGLVTLFAGADSLPYGGPANVAPSFDSAFVNTTCFIPDTLSVFNLLTPANNSTVTLSGAGSQTVNFTWEASAQSNGNPVTYTWSLETTNLNPQTLMSRSGLTSPNVNVDYLAIADTLQRRGVAVGGTFNGRWKVVANSGTQNRDAVARFNIAITRGVITSVEENALARAMQLYPNPATNSATLAYNLENAASLKVTIVNAIGQEVMTLNEASALRGEIALDLAGLKEGLYFVRISDGNELAVKRLMIQR